MTPRRREELREDPLERFGVLQHELAVDVGVDQLDACLEVVEEHRSEDLGHDQGAQPEPHDHQAGGEPLLVREPLRDRRHGRHVAEAEAAAADHAVAEEEHER